MTRPEIHGAVIDGQTRCRHWHSPLDVVAIRFACCGRYYPCDSCHAEDADHPTRRWSLAERAEPAVLCGVCGTELRIEQYLSADDCCPACGAGFNPGCRLHRDRYFEV